MARPTVEHDGFLIPNAAAAAYPRMAEPDQIDYSTAANARWGVIEGCTVTVASTTATCEAGIVVINGVLVAVNAGSVQLGVGGSQDRFDLLVATSAGALRAIPGAPAVDPVFPDVPDDCVLLASVYAPTGVASYANNVVDKRRFVSKALLTKVIASGELIRNVNGAGNYYFVRGDGRTEWANDTFMYRVGVRTLRIEDFLQLVGITATGDITGKNLRGTESVTAPNLIWDTTAPEDAPLGAIWQSKAGRVYVKTAGGWRELATIEGAVPVGSLIQSLEPPSVMTPLGWVLIGGQTVSEATYPSLFTLVALQGYISGIAPNRTMTLPNATGRVLMGISGGSAGALGGNLNNRITLSAAQMPKHKHNTRVSPGGSVTITGHVGRNGGHKHAVWGGVHLHPVTDPGHVHNGGEYPAGAFVCLVWGGRNKIDALFNDRNHTYSVEAVNWTRPAESNISIGSAGSEHAHDMSIEGDHDHTFQLDPIPAHPHGVTEDEVGLGAVVDITPAFLTTYTYIRS